MILRKEGISRSASAIAVIIVLVAAAAAGYLFLVQPATTTTSTTTTTTPSTSTVAPPTSTTTTPSGVAVPNPGTLVEETSDQPSTGYDPAVEWGPRGNIVMENVYETLVTYNGSSPDEFIPWLAQSWTVSPNGTVYTFTLRHGITFQDGTSFNATAVKFSLDRAILMHAQGGPEGLIAGYPNMAIKGGPEYWTAETVNVDNVSQVQAYLAAGGVKVIDPYTVQISLEHPYPGTIATMAFTVTSIVSPSYVIAHCPGTASTPGVTPGSTCDYMSDHPLGTGPYLLTQYVQNSITVLQAYTGYWGGPKGTGPAKGIQTYEIKYVQDIATRELDLYSGAADGINVPLTNVFDLINKTDWLTNHQIVPLKSGIRVWVAPTTQLTYMEFNPRIAPMNNSDFRKALAYSFPYSTYINQVLNGFGTRLYAPVPPGIADYDSALNNIAYSYNPTLAASLFQKVGYKGSVQITVRTNDPAATVAAQLLQSSVSQIDPNVSIQVNQVDSPTWSQLYRNYKTPMALGAWTWDISNPADFVPNLVAPGYQGAAFTDSNNNQTLINDVNNAAATSNGTVSFQLYDAVQRAVLNNAWDVFIASPYAVFAERTWVLPGNSSIGRAINNPMWGDGDGGSLGGYHPYYITKATTTSQVAILIPAPISPNTLPNFLQTPVQTVTRWLTG